MISSKDNYTHLVIEAMKHKKITKFNKAKEAYNVSRVWITLTQAYTLDTSHIHHPTCSKQYH